MRAVEDPNGPPVARRHRLNDDRTAVTHKFSFGGHEGYLTVGLYPNGKPGEIFIRMSKQGSTINGLMEIFRNACSQCRCNMACPLEVLCGKMAHTSFEPSGWTGNEKMGYAKSIWRLPRTLAAVPFSRRRTTRALRAQHSRVGDGSRRPQAGSCRLPFTCWECSVLRHLRLSMRRDRHMLYVPLMCNECRRLLVVV